MQQKLTLWNRWCLYKATFLILLRFGFDEQHSAAAFANINTNSNTNVAGLRISPKAFHSNNLRSRHPQLLFIGRGGSSSDEGKKSRISSPTSVLQSSSISEITEKPTLDSDENDETISPSSKQSESETMTTVIAEDDTFIKSKPDKRLYRAIRLKNGLEALLVSDPNTDVEAGAVHVKAGHFNDPDDRAGLAHFHEHMLFLGTEKYPTENDFETYLSKNGGSTNAYTSMKDTNYYFSVAPMNYDEEDEMNGDGGTMDPNYEEEDNDEDINLNKTSSALTGAMDRFSQFFISPTFREESAERELRAINSEYLNGITSDSWRSFQMLKSSGNPEHPFTKFGCGNYNTLTNGGDIKGKSAEDSGGSSPRTELLSFWDKYYHSNNIKLAVVGKASLDALQQTVEDTFGNVRTEDKIEKENDIIGTTANGNESIFVTENRVKNPAFTSNNLGIIKEVVPVLETRSIKLLFSTPPITDPLMKDARPQRVISHLLGHEAPGSLHSLLNDEGLINGLSSGLGVDTEDFSLFSFSLSLTPTGMKQKDRVIHLLFEWIALIRSAINDDKNGLMKEYHDELRKIAQNSFLFRENGDPTGFVSNVAELLFEYEPSTILAASSMTGEYDPDVTKAYMDRFRPNNALITVTDSDLGADDNEINTADAKPKSSAHSAPWETEKWYKGKYRQVSISEELLKEWESPGTIDPRLKLPKLNEFIPSDFSLRCDDNNVDEKTEASEAPTLVIDRPDLRLWHKMDRNFKVPKTFIRFQIISPNAYRNPRTMTYCRLFQKVLNDDLNSYVYEASMAGCNYSVDCLPNGFRVTVSGFSEKLPILLENLTKRMLSILDEMKDESEKPGLLLSFNKARENLLRQTKNYRLDSPYEVANYNSRILVEEKAWHVDSYVSEMEGLYAEKNPLTLAECARTAEECLMGRIKTTLLCMGNINEEEAKSVEKIINTRFLERSRPLEEDEIPVFRSLRLPTKAEASLIFDADMSSSSFPVIYEEVALSESEENSAVETLLQTDSEYVLGFEGVAVLELIGYMAYNSAFSQLRTKEQLGYIVSAFTRKTAGGARGLSVVVQSSSTLPDVIEERIEEWVEMYRKEIENMSEEQIAMEAGAVVAQLLERDTKLSEEVSRYWGEIDATDELLGGLRNPNFDKVKIVAEELTIAENEEDLTKVASRKTAKQLKESMLQLYDKYFMKSSPFRRAMSSRVYCHDAKCEMEKNIGKPGYLSSHAEVRKLKQYLSSWPNAPYWGKKSHTR